jgi:N-methylhydantoinase A
MVYRVGIDIGGTFTDFTVVDGAGEMWISKVPSNPEQPEEAVFAGLNQIAEGFGLDLRSFLQSCDHIIHGMTISTNAVIQRNGARTALLCTEGFRDILEIGDGHKPDVYNLKLAKPAPIVPRDLRLGVAERMDYAGAVARPLDREALNRHLDTVEESGVEAVAICYLWSNVNDQHEIETARAIADRFPDLPVMRSSEILPLIREWPRTTATVLSAYVQPGIAGYLDRLKRYLEENGLRHSLLVMQCTGGSTTVDEVITKPVYSLLSGPATAPIAALRYGERAGANDVISIDMGGTSFDVCLVQEGEPTITRELELAGIPLGVMATDIHSIGAGGGSIASIDEGGALIVGPRSAGSNPGPACYGRGGVEPTVTDANLVLGYLDPDHFLGGSMTLYPELAERAIQEHVADPLGIDVVEAAAGIFRLVNFHMVQGISFVSIERGLDPRQFLLVVGGGAGPAHAGMLADELGMSRLIVPRQASTLSAAGMATADVTRDYLQTAVFDSTDVTGDQIADVYRELREQAIEDLGRDGFPSENLSFRYYFDASYIGQVHELMINAPEAAIDDLDALVELFHQDHERLFTYRIDGNAVRFYHWRVRAIGHIAPIPELAQEMGERDPSSALKGARGVYFEQPEAGFQETPVYAGELLQPGHRIAGPALVEDVTMTTVVFPGHVLIVNQFGDYDYRLDGATASN